MKTLIVLTLIGLMVSCGADQTRPGAKKESSALKEISLTKSEDALKKQLLALGTIEQLELFGMLTRHSHAGEFSLNKLDQYLDIQCVQTSGLCHISKKE